MKCSISTQDCHIYLKEVGIDWFSVSVKPYVLGLIPGTYHRLENFHVKNNSRENFCVVKFSRFRSIDKLFLTVDSFIMDERLESSWRFIVYCQASGEQGIAGCSHRSDLMDCGLVRKLIRCSSPRNFIFLVLNFRSWTRLRSYFNSNWLRYVTS